MQGTQVTTLRKVNWYTCVISTSYPRGSSLGLTIIPRLQRFGYPYQSSWWTNWFSNKAGFNLQIYHFKLQIWPHWLIRRILFIHSLFLFPRVSQSQFVIRAGWPIFLDSLVYFCKCVSNFVYPIEYTDGIPTLFLLVCFRLKKDVKKMYKKCLKNVKKSKDFRKKGKM